MTKIICEICLKGFDFRISNTHLKKHNLSCKEYKKMFPNALLSNKEFKEKVGNASKGKSYLERYGKEQSDSLIKRRSDTAIKQFENLDQRKIRSEKCAKNRNYDLWYKNMCFSMRNPETIRKRLNTIEQLKKTKRGFILNNKSSKAAFNYIKKFITNNNLDENKCYFQNGGHNKKEWGLYDNESKKFFQYDLVCFNDKNEIELILEFNGPFHFTYEETLLTPDVNPCPWYGKFTIKGIYEKEILKLNASKRISSKVLVFWQKYNKLVEYKTIEDLSQQNILKF